MTVAELKKLRFNKVHPEYANATIPTLREVYELLKPTGLEINTELKTSHIRYEHIEEKCILLADEMGITPKRVAEVRKMSVPSIASSQFDDYTSMDGDVGTAPGVVQPSKVPFAQEAAYMSLDDNKKSVFDMLTGLHGQKRLPAKEVARRMGVSSSAISQQAKSISDLIADIVNRG